MAIRIVTDSTCDIPRDVLEKMGVYAAPLRVLFGEDTYLDGIDIGKAEFYEKLSKAEKLPTTSQVNPDEFEKIFKEYLDAGDTIIGVFIGSKLSGTYQSAVIAKQHLESEDIHLIDSKTATVSLGSMVRIAAKMRDDGAGVKEICDELTSLADRARLAVAPITLKYLQMGGRISGTAATIAGVLNITPIVQIADGAVTSAGKARGKKKVLEFILNYIKENDYDDTYPIAFTHSGDQSACDELKEYMTSKGGYKAWDFNDQMGSVVATHIGPGAYGVTFFTKK